MNGDSQKVEILYRILALQSKQRDVPLPHDFVQIHPGGIDPLAPHVIPAVEHVVEDLDSEMGHADFVYIWEAHGKTGFHFFGILHHRIDLAADIAGGLFNF